VFKKPIKLLVFLFCLSLAFPLFAEAYEVKTSCYDHYTNKECHLTGDYYTCTAINPVNNTKYTCSTFISYYSGTTLNTSFFSNSGYWWIDYTRSTVDPQDTDGILNGDETCVDGGGSTGVECGDTCPAGTTMESRFFVDGSGPAPFCVASTTGVMQNALGDCPDFDLNGSSASMITSGDQCVEWTVPTTNVAVSSDGSAVIPLDPYVSTTTAPWDASETENVTETVSSSTDVDGNETVSTVTTTSGEDWNGYEYLNSLDQEVINNVDGSGSTSTTETNTSRNPDGSSTTTTTQTTSATDTNGQSLGETTSTTEETSGAGGSGLSGVTADAPVTVDFQPFYDLKTDMSGRFPISLATTLSETIQGWSVTPAAPKWDLYFPMPIGSDISFSIDLTPMAMIAAIVRNCLGILFGLGGFFIVYKRWI
jgi:hypothetical protein